MGWNIWCVSFASVFGRAPQHTRAVHLAGDEPLNHSVDVLVRARVTAAAAIGRLTARCAQTGALPKTLAKLTHQMFQPKARAEGKAPSALRRMLGGTIVCAWAQGLQRADSQDAAPLPDVMPRTMLEVIADDGLFLELNKKV